MKYNYLELNSMKLSNYTEFENNYRDGGVQ